MGAFSGSVVSEVSRSYNSLSGTDIRAVIGNLTFAEIQAISYSITRKKAPLYTMGSPDPRAFSRNKRGIAGSLVWINFDRHALLALINTQGGTFVANVDDIRPQYTVTESNFIGQTVTFNSTITNADGTPASATIEQSADTPLSSASGFKALATPWASDQILPFDITLAGCNEYGAAASMKIFGVEILNEGWGTSVDDAVNEMQTTFIARLVCTRDTRWHSMRAPTRSLSPRGPIVTFPFCCRPEPPHLAAGRSRSTSRRPPGVARVRPRGRTKNHRDWDNPFAVYPLIQPAAIGGEVSGGCR